MPAARPLSHRLCHQLLQHRQESVPLVHLVVVPLARLAAALLAHQVAALLVHLVVVPQAAARRHPVAVQLPRQAQKQVPVLLTIRIVVHFKDLLVVVAVVVVVVAAVVAVAEGVHAQVVEGDLAPVVEGGQAQVVADRHQVVEVAAVVALAALQAVPVVVVQAALQEVPAAVAPLVVVVVGVELGLQEEGCLVPVEGPPLTTLCQPLIILAFVLYASTTYWGFLFIPTKDPQDTMVTINLSLDLVIVLMVPAILPIATNLTSYQVNDKTTLHYTTRH